MQSGLQRRLALALAGASGGARLLGSHASSLFKGAEEQSAMRSEALAREAQRFTQTLGELKGAYVKIGQMMALYGEHFLPVEVTSALHNLEHNTNPLPWGSVEQQINKNIPKYADHLSIVTSSLAAASLAQVHKAVEKNTQETIVLKVQYPGVAQTINSDFDSVLQMLRLARWLPNSEEAEEWLSGLKTMLIDEIDYQREAIMTERVAKLLANDDRYKVPKINKKFSTSQVLALEYIQGEPVTSNKVAKLSLKRRNALAYAMLENFFTEVFEWGVMQTDPNFGNYQVQLRKEASETDRLVLLDFGAVRELSEGLLEPLKQTILAAHNGDRQGVVDAAIALGCLQLEQNSSVHDSFTDFCLLLMEPFRSDHSQTPSFALNNKGIYHWGESCLLKRVGKFGANAILTEGFTSPPKEFSLIARKLTGVFTFISTIGAEFDARPIIEKYV